MGFYLCCLQYSFFLTHAIAMLSLPPCSTPVLKCSFFLKNLRSELVFFNLFGEDQRLNFSKLYSRN